MDILDLDLGAWHAVALLFAIVLVLPAVRRSMRELLGVSGAGESRAEPRDPGTMSFVTRELFDAEIARLELRLSEHYIHRNDFVPQMMIIESKIDSQGADVMAIKMCITRMEERGR